MHIKEVNCYFCKKIFLRELGRINEAEKKGWNQYCSKSCRKLAKNKTVRRTCANPKCDKIVYRRPSQIKKSISGLVFCSRSCAATKNNLASKKIKTCPSCNKKFFGPNKYCSTECRYEARKHLKIRRITKREIIDKIRKFYEINGRIPLKREFKNYKAARLNFKTWNKAIKSAGFKPNPVLFAKKYIAKDKHKCDSLSEKIIDDWLYSRKIFHERNISYPENNHLTADFFARGYIIEFFGLAGKLRKYDNLMKKKRLICKNSNIKLIEIYPKDIFPKNNLRTVLNILENPKIARKT